MLGRPRRWAVPQAYATYATDATYADCAVPPDEIGRLL
jgi:hypothetical protein